MTDDPRWQAKERIFDNCLAFLGKQVDVSPAWTVAEFGIGRWGFGRFYRRHVAKVYGIDIEDYARHHPDVEFVLSDGASIPLPDASVDMVASHSVLEHVADLPGALAEIDRITRPGGILFLTVTPLYYAAFGAHLYVDGKRLENWEHLVPGSDHYLIDEPIVGATTKGHYLNKLTSSKFLAAVGTVPWNILAYQLSFERAPVPDAVVRTECSALELVTRGFMFVGRKAIATPPAA